MKTEAKTSLNTEMKTPMKTTVISLGGSIVVPKEIDVSFLKQLKELVLEYIKENRLILVCGGGYTCRFYQDAAKKLSNKSS
ncbi:MAG: hypothetical protein ABIH82_02640, partial [Candidatus Woesearchaeota archaeon]